MANLSMSPACGEKFVRFVGDRALFELRVEKPLPTGWRAFLRTDLGRAPRLRAQIIDSQFRKLPLAGVQWHDVPMQPDASGAWSVRVALAEVG